MQDKQNIKFNAILFKKGSYITIEGKQNNGVFYIIKSGKVLKQRSNVLLLNDKEEELGPGDFFGVISCMSNRQVLETIVALEDSILIIIRREQFRDLIKINTPVALKILRYFSKMLRNYDSLLTKISINKNIEDNPEYLYNIAEYYLNKKKQPKNAFYAYMKYLKYCPNGNYAQLAKSKMAKLKVDGESLKPKKEGFYYIYEPEQIIFLEHEIGEELYIIKEGNVKIFKIVDNQEVLLNILKEGNIFGEMAILENKLRNACAVAESRVKLMGVNKSNFEIVVSQYPEIAEKIIIHLSNRIWMIYRQIQNVMIKDYMTRIYDALYIHLEKDRIPIVNGAAYTFDLTTNDLLNFICLNNDDGRLLIKELFDIDKNFTVYDGKICYKNIAEIEKAINIFQRQKQIKDKMQNLSF